MEEQSAYNKIVSTYNYILRRSASPDTEYETSPGALEATIDEITALNVRIAEVLNMPNPNTREVRPRQQTLSELLASGTAVPLLPWSYIEERCLGWYVSEALQAWDFNSSDYEGPSGQAKTMETIASMRGILGVLEGLVAAHGVHPN
jgi:hypothetical protein